MNGSLKASAKRGFRSNEPLHNYSHQVALIQASQFMLVSNCDFRCWHETVMPVLSPQVRYEGMNGPSPVAVRGPRLTQLGRRGPPPVASLFPALV